MLKITEDNYSYYKQILEIIWKHLAKLFKDVMNEDSSITKALGKQEQQNKSLARKILRITFMDALVMLSHMPKDTRKNIDAELFEKGFPSLNKLTSAINDTINKVLKRGKIKNLDEYYVIKEVVDDVDSNISEQDRIKLNHLFFDFEDRANRKRSK